MWNMILEYFQHNMDSYLLALREHIGISLLSLAIALLIGIPAGYLCSRMKHGSRFLISFFQILRIVPSLAVLLLLLPIMGTGIRPSMTALVLLAIPPILMNTATGFEEVPAFMLETAESLGMTGRQIFWKVRVPQALPSILLGAKTAFIEIIASATLAAYIGGGGLGTIIFTGLGLYRQDLLVIGGCSVALLSILAGICMDGVERGLLRYRYKS